MTEKDEYIVCLGMNQTRFYFKNKKLHREIGPAIVCPGYIEQYTNLADESLYTEKPGSEFISTIPNENKFNYMTSSGRRLSMFDVHYFTCGYYLEGNSYSEQKFNAIQLKKQLEQELKQKTMEDKKIKL